jgi:hypothetical protein
VAAHDPRAADVARACLRLFPAQPACTCALGAATAPDARTPELTRAIADAMATLAAGPDRALCESTRP